MVKATTPLAEGFGFHPGLLDRSAQMALVAALKAAVADAPFFVPTMPRTGKPFSVRMTDLGPLGWVSDRDGGYRYQPTHPETGKPWPPIPDAVMDIWRAVAGYPHPPEACLVNYYAPGARMGLHQDSDETDRAAPVVSISLGDTCLFRIGGTARKDPTRSLRLSSGDVVVLGGQSRMAYHGVDRLYPGTSTLLDGWFPEGGRLNLTLRRVTKP
ncbi:alpha-ketoglutarate-dependent dioxygenase AlkB family protein [Bauldia litoralis]|uniref:Alkylated DNA repair protein (DNA oxidative demethylase) n=1 Tax=Bauldia litoralis TaxID=665467 RepID=A0A1G6E010_9HYPH|nr:alpha-ketoglutarate-dependent dioxygenase AlkB [Bauldia litoralis]SDB50754.1 alkylated DNA repair protein (DNA oxidative demethylase) [Bauldia litoralis]